MKKLCFFMWLVCAFLGSTVNVEAVNNEAYFRAKNSMWGTQMNLSNTPSDTRYSMIASNGTYNSDYVVVVFADNLAGQYDPRQFHLLDPVRHRQIIMQTFGD